MRSTGYNNGLAKVAVKTLWIDQKGCRVNNNVLEIPHEPARWQADAKRQNVRCN